MLKYLKITISVIALILMSANGPAQAQSNVKRSVLVEQYKGKSYYIHFVQPGETLEDIAKAYDVSTEVILSGNPEAQQKVYVNQVLKIPVANAAAETSQKLAGPMAKASEQVKGKIVQEEIKSTPEATEKAAGARHITDPQAKQKQSDTYIQYTVKKKETLYGIAKKFNVTMDEILAANPGLRGIENGMVLRIPKKDANEIKSPSEQKVKPGASQGKLESYEVKPKETLYSIAKEHNISIEALIKLNPELADGLKTGLIIQVPASGKTETEPLGNEPIQRPEPQQEEAVSGSPCQKQAQQGELYKVAMMLPFDLSKSDSLLATDVSQLKYAGAYKAFNFIEIYEGALLALDSLQKTGANVKFYVYDCDEGNDTTLIHRILLKPEMKDMDLILGPVFAKSSAVAARYAAKYGINIVNPLSRRGEIIKGNTRIFKLQPSEAAIAEKLAAFIVQKHPNANVLIVRNVRSDNQVLAKLLPQKIKSILQQAGRSASAMPVSDIVYQTEQFTGVTKHLSTTKENIVIALSSNAVFIPDFISRLNNLHKSHHIILVGSPEWQALDPETDYLVNLNYHQYSFSWVDHTSAAIKEFRKKFQSRFSTEPENDKFAFLGYDLTFFFVKALLDYGHDFGPCIVNQPGKSGYPFSFRQSAIQDGYENMHLNILKIEDYQWVDAEK